MTVRSRNAAVTQQSLDLSWRRMMRLGVLGVASDLRDRLRDPALFNRPSGRALDPRLRRPVFIIGAPRSGTTFLGNSLGRLPGISYHFEPRLTKAAARCVYDGSWSARRGGTVFRLSYGALLLATLDGGYRFAEKNPENSFLVPFLAAEFPDAQFVHIVRDGRDATVSHAEQPWLHADSAAAVRLACSARCRRARRRHRRRSPPHPPRRRKCRRRPPQQQQRRGVRGSGRSPASPPGSASQR